MNVLLTNDDGYEAPGIKYLYSQLLKIAKVSVVAPLTGQSSTGHGITHASSLKIKRFSEENSYSGVAVGGRPADCMKYALSTEWPSVYGIDSVPDVIFSGINAGANVGIHLYYSGTVAAVREACFAGLPGIALSLYLHQGERPLWDQVSEIAMDVVVPILNKGLMPGEVLNINIPASVAQHKATPEVHFVPMSLSPLKSSFEQRFSPYGQEYIWSSGGGMDFVGNACGNDVDLLKAGKVVITPLHYDLTNYDRLNWWKGNN